MEGSNDNPCYVDFKSFQIMKFIAKKAPCDTISYQIIEPNKPATAVRFALCAAVVARLFI
jgi:hypothetical protein